MPDDPLVGQQLDEYRLEKLLGQGGMARIYRGLDINLKRAAAIKIIDLPYRANPDFAARFEREAQAIARLNHPNIVRVYRYGKAQGLLYIAMELIDGVNLETVLASHRTNQQFIAFDDASQIIKQLCLALDYAHSQGVIHRDIKPSNIMLNAEGHLFLTDFGLALQAEVETQGEIFGTAEYMAPEQVIFSASATPQSDLYAVGVILYEMFTNRLPFEAAHPHDVARMHVEETPPAMGIENPQLEAVILKALAQEPQNRFFSGAALYQALAQARQMPTPLRAASHKIAQERKPMSTQPTVFISYTREDEDEKEALLTHLRVLAQDRLIDIWSDDQIGVGDTWQREVEQAMTRADVAILLITADYLASSFIQDEQLPKLLHRCKDDGLKIFPIIAKPCAWQVVSWLKQMETRPKHGQAIWRSEGRYAHEDLAEIVSEIEGIVRQNRPGTLDDELIGTFLDKYQLIKLLGRGSAAKVYQTYHPGLYCYMAIKVMDSHLMSESALERFRGEAAAVVGLRHNNIIRVYDFNQAKGKHYMVMDLIEGPTLEAKLAARQGSRQPFTLDETIDIIDALADALDYAHSKGVIHHDLKPANIMFTHDDPKGQLILTDFGIARIMDAGNQTIAGMFLGTPNYTAPEQAQGQRGDKRSDIYSLGVILYEMLTGRLPFEADTSKNVIQQHINVPPLPPTQFNPELSTGVEQVILRALSKNPDDRYPSAGEMADALQRSLQMKELKKQDQVEEEVNNRPHLEIEIIKKFNDSCSSYQQALRAWHNKDSAEYEARLRNAATLAVGALEWALKDYLDLACNGTKDYAKVNRARFHELLGLMEQYGQPPLPALQSHQLSKYRKIRNAEQHEKITPTQQQVDRAITDVREFLLSYFVIEGEPLKIDCNEPIGPVEPPPIDPIPPTSPPPVIDIEVTLTFDVKALRIRLNQLFDDATLDAFCMDHFPKVFDRFGRGMRKDEKITLLLDYCRRMPAQQQKLLGALKDYDE